MDAMNRRNFLKISSVSLSLLTLEAVIPEIAYAKEKPTDDLKLITENGFSILQGLTTETSTQLSIDVLKTMKVNYELIEVSSGRKFDPHYFKSVSRKKPKWRVDKIGYTNLPILSEFKFRILDEKGKVIDERFLKLLDTQKPDARIAFMSCMNDNNDNCDKIWPVVQNANPDMLVFMGDNCYGDVALVFDGPDLLWNRYIETRQKIPYYHWKNLKPVLCTWDDHDYGKNNADGTYKHKKDSLASFKAFSAQEPIVDGFEQGPGASSFFKAFGHKFLLLDNRYFKNLKYDGINGFLGKEQMDWAFKLLAQTNEPNILIEGSQFFGGFRKGNECFQIDGPKEMEIFNKRISGLSAPSVFVAGDVHYSEVFKVPKEAFGYQTFEITSSCLHSYTRSSMPDNPSRLFGGVKENFVMMDLIPTRYDFSMNLIGLGIDKKYFEGFLSVA